MKRRFPFRIDRPLRCERLNPQPRSDARCIESSEETPVMDLQRVAFRSARDAEATDLQGERDKQHHTREAQGMRRPICASVRAQATLVDCCSQ
jgi:hypothetical protein